MLRKLLILGALLGVITAGAMHPADASHSLDNVTAQITGGVNIGSDPSVGLGPCTTAQGDAGRKAEFTDVVINGNFNAGDDGLAGFIGAVDVSTVNVCVHDIIAAGPLPILGRGSLASATYQSPAPATNALDPLGDDVCLYGTLHGGRFSNTGGVSSRALITTTYTINEPASGTCPTDPLDRGNVLASSQDELLLEADVLVIPAGQATQGEQEDQVSAQVHTVHHGIDNLLP